MEAAKLINNQQLEIDAVKTPVVTTNTVRSSSEDSPFLAPQDQVNPVTTDIPIIIDDTVEENSDMLSILASLPEVPANKPGQKYQKPLNRSATLPILPKSSPPEPPAGSDEPRKSSTLTPRSNRLPANFFNPYLPANYHSLPSSLSTQDLSGPPLASQRSASADWSSTQPLALKVSPLEQAHQKNLRLAAMYEKRAEQGRVNPGWRLELVRAQEVNLNIAREQEKTLAKKSEQRKQRLEQERLDEQNSAVQDDTIGIYEVRY